MNKRILFSVLAFLLFSVLAFLVIIKSSYKNNIVIEPDKDEQNVQNSDEVKVEDEETINSFEECVEAGYVVMESYPRKCADSSGKTFVEYIGNIVEKQDLIVINNPIPNGGVISPFTIEGQARGSWFFEASFPIYLYDYEGNEIGVAVAQTQNDWMTEEFVSFTAEMTFSDPSTEKGLLILKKDNPSGMSEYDDSLEVPVVFLESEEVSLFYYNSSLDEDENGNILCSEEGLVEIRRNIPVGENIIISTISTLLEASLTEEEIEGGISTEFPLDSFSLKEVTLENGNLTLYFDDPNNETVGGSCRVSVLRSQIVKTAEQFEQVESVSIMPEELFQP